MERNINDRIVREAEIFNEKSLVRGSLEKLLSHADSGPARIRRINFIKSIVQEHAQGDILEIGSEAWAPLIFHNGVKPQSLTCINISETAVMEGEVRARAENLDYQFRVMDAHKLEFEDASLDFVYGQAIVHHLETGTFTQELHRVLKPGSKMMFVEPLGYNPLAGLVRLMTPQARTDDERPLSQREFRIIKKYFDVERYCTELFYVPAAVISGLVLKDADNAFLRSADKFDEILTKYIPVFGLLCRTVTIVGARRNTIGD